MNASYSPKELAARWRCHPETVYRMIGAGKLKGFKVGRHWRLSAEEVAREEAKTQSTKTPCPTKI